MVHDIFQHDVEYIYSQVETGREPVLDADETRALQNYAMKRSNGFTPLLRFVV